MAERIWSELPADVEDRIVGFLSRNEVACTFRLINKAAAARFSGPQHVTVRLSSPVPHHAFVHRWLLGGCKSLPLKTRIHVICLTAASGDLVNLEVAVKVMGCVLTGQVLEAAAVAGHFQICHWLRQQGCPWGKALVASARAGLQGVCEWLLANGCPCDPEAVPSAARGGHVGLMYGLLARLPDPRVIPMACLPLAAAEGCDLATLQRHIMGVTSPAQPLQPQSQQPQSLQSPQAQLAQLMLQPPQPQTTPHPPVALSLQYQQRILAAAASSPSPDWRDKVEWLEGSLGFAPAWRACSAAAGRPDALERLRWLRQRGYPFDDETIAAAAQAGNLPALSYILDAAGPDEDMSPAATWAAAAGQLAALKLVYGGRRRGRGSGAGPSPRSAAHVVTMLTVAAAHGHGGVVAWVLGEGAAAVGTGAVPAAAEPTAGEGLAAEMAPVEETTAAVGAGTAGGGRVSAAGGLAAEVASSGESSAVVAAAQSAGTDERQAPQGETAGEEGPKGEEEEREGRLAQRELEEVRLAAAVIVASAARSGSLALLKHLYDRGFRWDEQVLSSAAAGGCAKVLDWLVEHGYVMSADGEPYLRAARNGDLATLAWLRNHGCPWGPPGETFTSCVGDGLLRTCAPLGALRWLVEAGCPVDWQAAVAAARSRRSRDDRGQVGAWLLEERRRQQERS